MPGTLDSLKINFSGSGKDYLAFQMPGLFHHRRETRRCYVVCAIPRSGSNLLSDGLSSTRRAGRPSQFFWPPFEHYFRRRHGLSANIGFADYVRAISQRNATSNGVFGFKLMARYVNDFLDRLRQTRAFGQADDSDFLLLQNAFPQLRFIHITRRNRLRQAISKARAVQSGLWKIKPHKTESGSTVFDRALINRCLKEAEEGESAWNAFFHRISLEPFHVEYEELCQDYEGVIHGVLDFLHIVLPRGATLIPPITKRQSDELSTEWERRYLASSSSRVL